MAIEECDPDLVKKAAPAAAPAPAAAAAKPAAAAAPKPAAQKVTLAADALFDFNKADLRAEGKAKLDKLATDIKGIKLEVIIAVGHADRIGTDAYNQKLSEKRAEAVKAYLVSKGVEPNRVYTEGKGKKQPVTKADQCKGPKSKKVMDCLQPDRRVEIEVIGTK
jgi:OOP family OmpA-OmpF porin